MIKWIVYTIRDISAFRQRGIGLLDGLKMKCRKGEFLHVVTLIYKKVISKLLQSPSVSKIIRTIEVARRRESQDFRQKFALYSSKLSHIHGGQEKILSRQFQFLMKAYRINEGCALVIIFISYG